MMEMLDGKQEWRKYIENEGEREGERNREREGGRDRGKNYK